MFPPSQSGARPEFKTDALRPSALPSAAIRPRNEVQQPELTSEQYLNTVYEEWNKKVDVEVETLVDGMVDLVSIAAVSKATEYIYLSLSLRSCRRLYYVYPLDFVITFLLHTSCRGACLLLLLTSWYHPLRFRLATKTSIVSPRRPFKRKLAQNLWWVLVIVVSFCSPPS